MGLLWTRLAHQGKPFFSQPVRAGSSGGGCGPAVSLETGVIRVLGALLTSLPLSHIATWQESPEAVSAAGDLGLTPLHWAAKEGMVGVAELLIAKGADVLAKSENSWTPLHQAACHGEGGGGHARGWGEGKRGERVVVGLCSARPVSLPWGSNLFEALPHGLVSSPHPFPPSRILCHC